MSDSPTQEHRSSLPGILGHIDNFLAKAESMILALGVLLMALNTVANVVSRFTLGESLHFSEEVNRILIVMITFAGIGYAARHGRHIRMSAIYDALPYSARRIMMIIIAAITGTIMFMLCYWSVGYVLGNFRTGRVLPTLGYPIWFIYIWVPIGLAVTGIQYWMTAIKNITTRDGEIYLSTAVTDGYDDEEEMLAELQEELEAKQDKPGTRSQEEKD